MTMYTVATGSTIQDLIKSVQARIHEGYEVQGGIASTYVPHSEKYGNACTDIIYTQAMIKKIGE